MAPEAAIARTVARSSAGLSPRKGITGAIRTPQPDAVVREGAHDVQAAFRGRGARLDGAPQLGVGEIHQTEIPTSVTSEAALQVEVAQDQRALRQDREGVRVVAQGRDDAGISR